MTQTITKRRTTLVRWPFLAGLAMAVAYCAWYRANSGAGSAWARDDAGAGNDPRTPLKVRIEKDKQYLWAKGPIDPAAERSEWFDMTGSPLPLDQFQFGLGRDTIRSIDHPRFAKANDPRLRAVWERRKGARIDDLPIIGYAHNGVARAYPVPLLNRHELVNDTVGGKPVTVGW